MFADREHVIFPEEVRRLLVTRPAAWLGGQNAGCTMSQDALGGYAMVVNPETVDFLKR